jgi:hypothetical protein
MSGKPSIKARAFLKCYWTLSKERIAQCTNDTRLYHDLGIYGDDAEFFFLDLEKKHHVNLKNFNIDKYFPAEFGSKKLDYPPFTIGMLDEMIHTKQCRSEMLFKGADITNSTKNVNIKSKNNQLWIIISLCLFLIYIIIRRNF